MCQLLHVGIDQAKTTCCRTWDRSVLTSVRGRTPQRIPSVFVKCQRNLSFSTFAAIWISSRLSLCFVIANAKANPFLGQILGITYPRVEICCYRLRRSKKKSRRCSVADPVSYYKCFVSAVLSAKAERYE